MGGASTFVLDEAVGWGEGSGWDLEVEPDRGWCLGGGLVLSRARLTCFTTPQGSVETQDSIGRPHLSFTC